VFTQSNWLKRISHFSHQVYYILRGCQIRRWVYCWGGNSLWWRKIS